MKKKCLLLAVFSCFALTQVQAAEVTSSHPQNHQSRSAEKYEIIKRNRIDSTDTLAIPFDDSEVEDEEEINTLEKKEVFDLPDAPQARQPASSNTNPR